MKEGLPGNLGGVLVRDAFSGVCLRDLMRKAGRPMALRELRAVGKIQDLGASRKGAGYNDYALWVERVF